MTNLPDVSFDPTNPDPRCACVLVLDTSGSMYGEKIDQLNQGLAAFRDSLQTDSVAQSRVEIAIVTFGPAQLLQDFTGASQFTLVSTLASGGTALTAVVASWLMGTRNAAYSMRMTPILKAKGPGRLVAVQLTIDESTAMGSAAGFEVGCIVELAKLQANSPGISMLRFIFESCEELRAWALMAFDALDVSDRMSLQAVAEGAAEVRMQWQQAKEVAGYACCMNRFLVLFLIDSTGAHPVLTR